MTDRSTESLSEVANRERSTGSHGEDGAERTHEAVTQLPMNPSSNATPAGGLEEINHQQTAHNHNPHIYLIYWPDYGIIKAGITEAGNDRWKRWLNLGAVIIATTDTCCMPHARTIESWLLSHIGQYAARAFSDAADAQDVLGYNSGGWTECYRLVQSPHLGEKPEDEFDYERAYGLILPVSVDEYISAKFKCYPIIDAWRSA